MLRATISLLVTAHLPLTASAPNTLIVGPGGFAQIDPANQATQPGDTIRIVDGGGLQLSPPLGGAIR